MKAKNNLRGFAFESLERDFPKITFQKGDIILHKGRQAEYVYRILTGRIGIYNATQDGKIDRVVWAMPGESIGEMEVLAGEDIIVFEAEACENNTTVIRIPKADYLDMLKRDIHYSLDAARTVASKLYTASATFCERATSDAPMLIRRFILETTREALEREGSVIVPYTRSAIADNCGISERTVNRCVGKLKENGLIALHRGKISITKEQYKNLLEHDE